MLTGKKLGEAIKKAIELKMATGAVRSKTEIAQHFGIKPPSIHDWIKKGTISKDKLPELWAYFSDVVTSEHWGLASASSPASLNVRKTGADDGGQASPCAIGRTVALMEQMTLVEREMLYGHVETFFAQSSIVKAADLSAKTRAIISFLMLPENRRKELSDEAQCAVRVLEKEPCQNLLSASCSGLVESKCYRTNVKEMLSNAAIEAIDNAK